LSRREHSRLELVTKLSKKDYSEEDIQAALVRIDQHDLQSDERFAEQFIRAKLLKLNGPMLIRYELKQRGIDESLIIDFLDQQQIDWLQVAQALYEKKYGSKEVSDYQEKARRMRFLQSKGFPGDIIQALMK
jgi:regulatory protein